MTAERIRAIEERLRKALDPSALDVIDEGHLHAGHAGARDGRGHFRVVIESAQFAGLRPLQIHRLVYDAVGDLMATDIHALTIEHRTPDSPT